MTTLDKIFDVWYGVNLEVVNSEVVERGIPFVSRQAVDNGVVCHVRKIEGVTPNPAHTLSIAVSGSVLSTFYHDCEYYSGRDVYIAKPKEPMTREEMLYYAVIIEANKYKYNYGRGANKTFRNIIVPEKHELPKYINTYKAEPKFSEKSVINKKYILSTKEWMWFDYRELFRISGSKTTSIEELKTYGDGEYPYVTTQAVNNGVEGFYNFYTEKGGVLTIDSAVLGFCAYQEKDFSASDHVEILTPLFEMNRYIAIFLVTLINKEQYRYNYGRKCSHIKLKKSRIKLPAIKDTQGNWQPDWKYMEEYIKSLPYSVNLEINEKAKLLNEIETYKHKVAALETQLAAQHSAEVHYHIDHVDNLNLGDNVENKFS